MRLEDQVCSLDLAKRLKELGVKQESFFYWHSDKSIVNPNQKHGVDEKRIICSAFTVAELGEMLPGKYQMVKDPHWRPVNPQMTGSQLNSMFKDIGDPETEAEARAKMLIHLIEKGLVKPKEGGGEV